MTFNESIGRSGWIESNIGLVQAKEFDERGKSSIIVYNIVEFMKRRGPSNAQKAYYLLQNDKVQR